MRSPCRRIQLWRAIAAAVALLCAVSCSTGVYRYISLDSVPGIEVIEHGKPQAKAILGASSMPTLYRLRRDSYELVFRVNVNVVSPAVYIHVEPIAGAGDALRLVAQTRRKTTGSYGESCGGLYQDPGAPDKLSFGWGCPIVEVSPFISFDVIAMNGTLIGQEDIPFKLRPNGVYALRDGL